MDKTYNIRFKNNPFEEKDKKRKKVGIFLD